MCFTLQEERDNAHCMVSRRASHCHGGGDRGLHFISEAESCVLADVFRPGLWEHATVTSISTWPSPGLKGCWARARGSSPASSPSPLHSAGRRPAAGFCRVLGENEVSYICIFEIATKMCIASHGVAVCGIASGTIELF